MKPEPQDYQVYKTENKYQVHNKSERIGITFDSITEAFHHAGFYFQLDLKNWERKKHD